MQKHEPLSEIRRKGQNLEGGKCIDTKTFRAANSTPQPEYKMIDRNIHFYNYRCTVEDRCGTVALRRFR